MLIALVAMWVGVQAAVQRYLRRDLEGAYAIAGQICVPVWLIWVLIGAGIRILTARAR